MRPLALASTSAFLALTLAPQAIADGCAAVRSTLALDDGSLIRPPVIVGDVLYTIERFDEFPALSVDLLCIDLSDPGEPIELGRAGVLRLTDGCTSASVVDSDGTEAVVMDYYGLHLFDVTNPTRPVRIASMDLLLPCIGNIAVVMNDTAVYAMHATLEDTILYTISRDGLRDGLPGPDGNGGGGGGGGGTAVLDVERPDATGQDMLLVGDTLVLSAFNNVQAWDITDPADPELAATQPVVFASELVAGPGGAVYVAGLPLARFSGVDPLPEPDLFPPITNNGQGFAVRGGLVVTPRLNGGIDVRDIATGTPTPTGIAEIGGSLLVMKGDNAISLGRTSDGVVDLSGCLPPQPCTTDTNDDGVTDLADLLTVLAHFGQMSGATQANGDTDNDGDVELTDLVAVLDAFGTDCP